MDKQMIYVKLLFKIMDSCYNLLKIKLMNCVNLPLNKMVLLYNSLIILNIPTNIWNYVDWPLKIMDLQSNIVSY